ncbi:uncharacterized protein EI90DRAFT_3020554 [Cantharellus anzutake]|uniref:uncharacterized protein n=1 Tax=Cantharellus anzutake TaxID=1750568 RepID=UPI001903A575|nr:uncharacterized protein EI90DRAFT_3020554 [Cantharellus anzutake]KAF8320204.1 hypothetical protein EI90DRAFT_3020554 [Cantharellus anzutake]
MESGPSSCLADFTWEEEIRNYFKQEGGPDRRKGMQSGIQATTCVYLHDGALWARVATILKRRSRGWYENHLGLNAAVLIGWILLSMCTTVLFQYLVRRVSMKDYLRLNNIGRMVGEEEVGPEGSDTGPESLLLSEDRERQHPPRIETTKEIMDREAKE